MGFLSRRRLLRSAGGLGAASVLAGTASLDALLQQIGAKEDFSAAQAQAVRAMRYLNSAQARHWGLTKAFAPLDHLLESEACRQLGGCSAINPGAFLAGGGLVGGFRMVDRISGDATRYRFMLIQPSAGVAYATTETGVIHSGRFEEGQNDEDFAGSPLEPPAARRSSEGPLGHTLARIAQFLVPTLQANQPAACCGVCGGHCFQEGAGSCGTNCAPCCNLGYSSCIWCCSGDCGCSNGC